MAKPKDILDRIWRYHRAGWSNGDIAAYLEISQKRVEAYLAIDNPPPREIDEGKDIVSVRGEESPRDISHLERYVEGGIVRWRQPK